MKNVDDILLECCMLPTDELDRVIHKLSVLRFTILIGELTDAEIEVSKDMFSILSSDDADENERHAAMATLMEALK